MSSVTPLANDCTVLFESPDPARIFSGSPGLAVCPSGTFIATHTIRGPGAAELPGIKGARGKSFVKGRVLTSHDHGATFCLKAEFPFTHARPFVAGDALYVIGHCGDLTIMRSDDEGATWTEPTTLTDGQSWHQSACNVHYANGCVYLVMERQVYSDCRGWAVSVLAPVLMRGRIGEDLTQRGNWTFASELVFRDAVPTGALDYFGVPFFETPPKASAHPGPKRECAPIGWLETNVVQFLDPDHYLCDPTGHTFHLYGRAHTGGTGFAALAKVVEDDSGAMTTSLETAPSGRRWLYVPLPGGQMRFHILYDDVTRLYWLLSTQAIDSMTRAERLPADRYNLPNNQRSRLQLHFSKNGIDWCFAGMVAIGETEKHSRHYASMVIDRDDLHVLSRSGDHRSKSAHDGNLVTFHTVRGFRSLVY